jgi:hypothetical protein
MNRAQERRAWEEHFFPGSTKKESKYRNEKVESGGRKFDSKREAERAGELELWQKLGIISNLQFQVKFQLVPKQPGERAVTFKADFTYIQDGEFVAEDVKSKATKTQQYIIRRKLMLQVHGIRVREVE